ncbi:unnamed protein product [Prunus brigantina]
MLCGCDDPKHICPKCLHFIPKPMTYFAMLAGAADGKGGGLVREAVTYMLLSEVIMYFQGQTLVLASWRE